LRFFRRYAACLSNDALLSGQNNLGRKTMPHLGVGHLGKTLPYSGLVRKGTFGEDDLCRIWISVVASEQLTASNLQSRVVSE
jgi:hypothetical protein